MKKLISIRRIEKRFSELLLREGMRQLSQNFQVLVCGLGGHQKADRERNRLVINSVKIQRFAELNCRGDGF